MACAWRGPDTIRFNQVSRAGASGVWSPCCLSGRDVRVAPAQLSYLARPDQKGQKDCPGLALCVCCCFVRNAGSPPCRIRHCALGGVGCKPLWRTVALGVGCWNTDTSTTRCPARLLPAVTASRMVMFASLNRALRPGAVDFGALGPRALGGAGSPPNMAPGRWVFGREYLDDDESYFDSKTRSGILGTYITFPEGDLRIGGGWFLGVGCSVGVGCWALGRGGVGCSNADISTTGRRISIPRPAVALPGAVVSFLSRACPYLAVGSWALGGAGSPPRRWVPGRWVFERGYLRDQAPDLAPETAYGIPGVPITLPKEGLRIGKGWFLGVGCWALGVRTSISRRRAVQFQFRDRIWHPPGSH